jgi:hypothetical protein
MAIFNSFLYVYQRVTPIVNAQGTSMCFKNTAGLSFDKIRFSA